MMLNDVHPHANQYGMYKQWECKCVHNHEVLVSSMPVSPQVFFFFTLAMGSSELNFSSAFLFRCLDWLSFDCDLSSTSGSSSPSLPSFTEDITPLAVCLLISMQSSSKIVITNIKSNNCWVLHDTVYTSSQKSCSTVGCQGGFAQSTTQTKEITSETSHPRWVKELPWYRVTCMPHRII